MTGGMLFIFFIILTAFAFDFSNGWHDAANSIATVVSTRVLSPMQAVVWAAFFNFVAAFTFGTAVAKTVGGGLIDIRIVDPFVILAGLLGAITWNVITWRFGLPSSSSHALVGGYAGAAIAKAGFAAVLWSGWIKVIAFIFISPLLGFVLGWLFMKVATSLLRYSPPGPVTKWARRMQLVSAGAYSLAHGTNDAQKTMGIIVGLLVASHGLFSSPESPFHFMNLTTTGEIPVWVILSAHAAIALGTLSGGWRIVRTMGQRITKLHPVGGFCAETAGAITLFGASALGIPVSTTHTITGAIVGVGSSRRMSAVKWGVASRIVWAWILTIPIAALVGYLLRFLLGLI
ncbi:MAG: inorganic phosphate transporter [Thermoanaerobaculia bacterium]